jgi:hypothetical protein
MSKNSRILLTSGIVVILLIVGFGVWWVLTHNMTPGVTTQTSPTAANNKGDADAALYSLATKTAVDKGAAAGQAVLDAQLAKTTDAVEQAIIYGNKASLASSTAGGSDQTTALSYAIKSDSLNPTGDSAEVLAGLYAASGDKKNAIIYYQKAIDRIGDYNSASATDQAFVDFYKQQILELQK